MDADEQMVSRSWEIGEECAWCGAPNLEPPALPEHPTVEQQIEYDTAEAIRVARHSPCRAKLWRWRVELVASVAARLVCDSRSADYLGHAFGYVDAAVQARALIIAAQGVVGHDGTFD